MVLVPITAFLDLTSDIEQCAFCGVELGQGIGKAAQMFVLQYCRCVSELESTLIKLLNQLKRLFAASVSITRSTKLLDLIK
jgi:hypothetical protein